MDYYVTADRLKELKKELETLKTEKRIEVAKRLKRAKELGDLSENSEYTEAREEQTNVERRIYELEQMVKNASIITKPGKGTGMVQIGSTVSVSSGGEHRQFTIVGSSETKPEEGFISNESPIGGALLNKEVGAIVTIKAPKGEVIYKIEKIA